LQLALVAPASRGALAAGKTAGGVAVALAQAAVFCALAPLAGFSAAAVDWLGLAVALLCASVALTSLGLALAWVLDSTQGYHAVMSVLLIPMWVLSGAMFPVEQSAPALAAVMRANPMTYLVAAARRALSGGSVEPGLAVTAPWIETAVAVGFAAAMLAVAIAVIGRRR
jgi:ABC-type polysaccharide/polyol phosphate export permease